MNEILTKKAIKEIKLFIKYAELGRVRKDAQGIWLKGNSGYWVLQNGVQYPIMVDKWSKPKLMNGIVQNRAT